MTSISFDPIAHLYDETRGYPAQVAQQIAQAIDSTAAATPETAFLEMGVGTGRIMFPLVSLGRTSTGIDISEQMLARLETKLRDHGWQEHERAWGSATDEDRALTPSVKRFSLPQPPASLRLVTADMTRLPFLDASFDVVIAVHVFHLIENWQQAVEEARRVLRPGGLLLHCWDEHDRGGISTIRMKLDELLHGLNTSTQRPGANSHHEIEEYLRLQGLQTERVIGANWEQSVSIRQAVERIGSRSWSSTWKIPDDIFATSVEQLWQWIHEQYGDDLDRKLVLKHQFIISKTRM